MPAESHTVYPAYRFSIAPMLDRMYRFEKQLVIHFVGAYWEPEVLLFLFISIHKAPFAALSD